MILITIKVNVDIMLNAFRLSFALYARRSICMVEQAFRFETDL